MNTQNKNILIGIVVLIIVVLLGYFAWKERGTNGSTVAATSTVSTTTVTVASSTSSGYTITPVALPTSGTPVAPNFKAPLVFSSSVSASDQASLQSEFAQAQAAIASNPVDLDAIIALGNVRKEAGDYAGAAADWQYVSEMSPTNPVSFANLADLYTNFLPDYPKAAAAYKQQIANDPTDIYIYEDLFQLYTIKYPQGSSDPSVILKQGIAANPKAINLQVDLARYYKAKGDSTDAQAEYQAAIANANSQGQTSTAQELQQESSQ